MTEVKTEELIGVALDWATAKAAGWISARIATIEMPSKTIYEIQSPSGLDLKPSIDWSTCGPLISRFQVALTPEAHDGREGTEMSERWSANVYYDGGDQYTIDSCETALIAACRAIVATKFGDVVQVPSVLMS